MMLRFSKLMVKSWREDLARIEREPHEINNFPRLLWRFWRWVWRWAQLVLSSIARSSNFEGFSRGLNLNPWLLINPNVFSGISLSLGRTNSSPRFSIFVCFPRIWFLFYSIQSGIFQWWWFCLEYAQRLIASKMENFGLAVDFIFFKRGGGDLCNV